MTSGTIYELCPGEGLKPVNMESFTDLKRGTIIHWGGNMGYPEEDLVILEKVKGWEGRINYKVVNLKRGYEPMEEYTPHIRQVESWSIKDRNDKSLWHSQHHFITDRTVSEEEIKKVLDFVPIAEARNRKAEEDRIKAIKDAGQLTKSEKVSLSTKEITSRIRQQLKQKYPECKFSVTMKSYSGGSSITLSLMEAPFKVFRDYDDISEDAKSFYYDNGRRTQEELKASCSARHAQLNHHTTIEEYNPDRWNNGHFLTREAHDVLKEDVKIANYYNYDDSDSMTDYFDVNYYLHLHIGKWDKEFKQVV